MCFGKVAQSRLPVDGIDQLLVQEIFAAVSRFKRFGHQTKKLGFHVLFKEMLN